MAVMHTSSGAREEIHRHLLECPVCLEHFDEKQKVPRILHCQHTFCEACLHKIVKGDNVTCPTCNLEHVVKNGDVTVFYKDNTRRNLMEIVGRQKRDIKLCTQCDEGGVADTKCSKCGEFLCADCTKAHRRTKLTAHHPLESVVSKVTDTKSEDAKTEMHGVLEDAKACQKNGHDKHEFEMYCLHCDEPLCKHCSSERHKQHDKVSLEIGYERRRNDMEKLSNTLRKNNLESAERKLIEQSTFLQSNCLQLKENIRHQMDLFTKVIHDRKEELQSKIEEISIRGKKQIEEELEKLHNMKEQTNNAISYMNTLLNNADKMTFFKSFKPLRDTMNKLKSEEPVHVELSEIRFSQACTTEDFTKLLQAVLGHVHEYGDHTISGAYKSGIRTSMTCTDEASVRSQQYIDIAEGGNLFMEVLKSFDFGCSEPLPSLKSWISQQIKAEKLESSHTVPSKAGVSIEDEDVTTSNEDKVVESNIARGRRGLYDSRQLRSLVTGRFKTWGLVGNWKSLGNDIVMYSKSLDEAEQCMQLLKEAVFEKVVDVKKDSMFIVESDKWLTLRRHLLEKYPDLVTIDVLHAECQLACYSTCTNALKDVSDAIMIFFRDNERQALTLTFAEPIVTAVMKCKDSLDKIRASYSQYCIEITGECETVISIKGIGFGVGQAVLGVHTLAMKCASGENESGSRFDSDDDNDDDENGDDDPGSRFLEEPVGGKVTLTQMTMVGVEGMVQAICFPGDDRMVYITEGDITQLPVEALVNAADAKLKHNGGLAKVIVQKGGRSIQEECSEHVSKHGQMTPGEVFCSKAGTLPNAVIIHAVGPKWIDGQHEEIAILEKAVTNILLSATSRRLASIALPAIGTGTFGFPVELSTKTIVTAVKKFLIEKPRSTIRTVYLCDVNSRSVTCFTKSVKECFQDADTVRVDICDVVEPASPAKPDERKDKSSSRKTDALLFF